MSTFYCLRPEEFQGAVSPFYEALTGLFPLDVTIQLENSGDYIDPLTGQLMASWATALPSPKQGTNAGASAGPAGAVCTWLTGSILDGTRLRGRTFIVPMGISAYDQDGTLNPGTLLTLQNAASNLVAAAVGNMVVWHRPIKAGTFTRKGVPVPPRAGGYSVVTGSRVSDRVAVLRSRRG